MAGAGGARTGGTTLAPPCSDTLPPLIQPLVSASGNAMDRMVALETGIRYFLPLYLFAAVDWKSDDFRSVFSANTPNAEIHHAIDDL